MSSDGSSFASLRSYELLVPPRELSYLLTDAMNVIGNFAQVAQLDALPSLSQMRADEREHYKAHLHSIYLAMISADNSRRFKALDKLSIAARVILRRKAVKELEQSRGLDGVIRVMVEQSQSQSQSHTQDYTEDDDSDDNYTTSDGEPESSDDEGDGTEEEKDEEELTRQEQVGLILDMLIDPQTLFDNVNKARIKYEEHKRSLANMFAVSLTSPNFEIKDMWLNILNCLVKQGEAFHADGRPLFPLKLEDNKPKPSRAYLDYFEKQATTYTIGWNNFFEMLLIIILDTKHDLPRVVEGIVVDQQKYENFKRDFGTLLGYVAQGLVHKLPDGIREPELMAILRGYANNTIGDFETDVLNELLLSFKKEQQQDVKPGIKSMRVALSSSDTFEADELTHAELKTLIRDGYCLDNASGLTEELLIDGVKIILSKMGSFSILFDGGSNNVCPIWFFTPQNFILKYNYLGRTMSFHIFESLAYDDEKKVYVFNIYIRIKSTKKNPNGGENIHQYTAVHTLPLCSSDGIFKGNFRSIILQSTAAKVWAELLAAVNSGDLPKDALKLLAEIMLKCLGDKKIVHDMVIGPIFENGGLLPYLYSPTVAEVDKLQKQYGFDLTGYNEFVRIFNIKAKNLAHSERPFVIKENSVDIHVTVERHFRDLVETFFSKEISPSKLSQYHHYIATIFGIQKKIYGACNDRMAHASAAHLVMSLQDNAQLPCLKYQGPAHNGGTMRSYLRCCGQQLITVTRHLVQKDVVQQLNVKAISNRSISRNRRIFTSIIPPEEVSDCGSSVAGSTVTENQSRRPFTLGLTPSAYSRDCISSDAIRMARHLMFPNVVGGNTEEPLHTVPEDASQSSDYQRMLFNDDDTPSYRGNDYEDVELQSPSPTKSVEKRLKEGGSTALQQKRTVKRRRTNNRKTQQYSNKKKHSSNKKKSVITKKTNVSKSKRNNKRKTKRRMNH